MRAKLYSRKSWYDDLIGVENQVGEGRGGEGRTNCRGNLERMRLPCQQRSDKMTIKWWAMLSLLSSTRRKLEGAHNGRGHCSDSGTKTRLLCGLPPALCQFQDPGFSCERVYSSQAGSAHLPCLTWCLFSTVRSSPTMCSIPSAMLIY